MNAFLESKICPKCGVEHPLTNFYRRTSGSIDSWCKFCKSARATVRRKERRQTVPEVKRRDYLSTRRYFQRRKSGEKIETIPPNPELSRKNFLLWRKNYRSHKYLTDLGYRLTSNLRTRRWQALKGHAQFEDRLLGCGFEHLKLWITFYFQPGMSWGNYGKVWEIDHIRPCASFDLSKEADQRECFHFSNLQPLFKSDNRKKSDKWV